MTLRSITSFREDSMSFTERVARFGFRHEAEFAKGYLDDAGIESLLLSDDAGGNLGLAWEHEATLMVRITDLPRARQVLSEAGVLEDDNA
jgi:hypothetical protein